MQRYKLFYNQIALSVTRFKHFGRIPKKDIDYFVFDASLDMEQLLTNFLSRDKSVYIFYNKRSEKRIIIESIKSFFHFQKAAGGLVIKDDNLLTIYRHERWDFPKGHVEEGETDQEAAMREVTEETGVDDLSISNDLGSTFHVFHSDDNQFVLKETHWFEMRTTDNKKPCPQTEESILLAEWIPLANIDCILKNTYPSVADLIKSLQRKRKEQTYRDNEL
jgi:ADP-ribose pyrophosphatase YjhB (NUDIX family)